jgi:hypothetical protein
VIRESDAAKELQWKPTFGAEWPARRTFPSRIVRDGESLAVDNARAVAERPQAPGRGSVAASAGTSTTRSR